MVTLGTVIIIFITLNNKQKDDNNIAFDDACGGEVLDEFVSVLAPINYSKKVEIEQMYNKAKAIDKYQENPNCLYPVFQHYVSVGDLANAISTFKMIEALTEGGAPYAGDRFLVTVATMRELSQGFEKTVESLNSSGGIGGFGAKP